MKMNPYLIPRFNLDYSFSDLLYSLGSAFSNEEYELNSLESIFGEKTFLFSNYGRTSLYIILKSLNLPKGSKIGVPLYSCTVVFDAIVKAGYTPCFIDINLDNYTMDTEDLESKIDDLSAVVVIHTFGRPAEMDEIRKIAIDIPIIEDCAHSLLSEYKGEITGTIGTASFFSLSKYISCGGGGMIVLNDKSLVEKVKKEISILEAPSFLNEVKHTFTAYIRSFFYHKPWFGLFSLPIGIVLDRKVDLTNKRSFRTGRISKGDLKLMLKKFNSFKDKVELQRKNSFFLIEELKSTNLKLPYERENTYCNYYLFPLLFENRDERDRASKLLRDRGVDTMKMYSETPLKAKRFYGYTGNCPNTELLADTVLIIPNHYSLKKIELIKIAESVKDVV